MILSCASEMIPGTTFTEKANRLRQWGYGGMTVFAEHGSWNNEKMEELLHLEESTSIVPCEFIFISDAAGKLMSENEEESSATLSLYMEAAEICAKISAVTEIEYLYGAQDPLPLFDIYKQVDERQEARFLDLYRKIVKPVIGTKAAVLLEGINRYESPYFNSIIDCNRIVSKLGMKETGILADFFHMSIEETNIAAAIEEVGTSIAHVHLGDNNRRLPGYGSINWVEGLKALKKVGYAGFLSMECSTMGQPEKALPEAAEYVKNILASI